MAFSNMQKEFFANADHRWNIKSGATRSGKTYMDFYVIPKRIRSRMGKEGLCTILECQKEQCSVILSRRSKTYGGLRW